MSSFLLTTIFVRALPPLEMRFPGILDRANEPLANGLRAGFDVEPPPPPLDLDAAKRTKLEPLEAAPGGLGIRGRSDVCSPTVPDDEVGNFPDGVEELTLGADPTGRDLVAICADNRAVDGATGLPATNRFVFAIILFAALLDAVNGDETSLRRRPGVVVAADKPNLLSRLDNSSTLARAAAVVVVIVLGPPRLDFNVDAVDGDAEALALCPTDGLPPKRNPTAASFGEAATNCRRPVDKVGPVVVTAARTMPFWKPESADVADDDDETDTESVSTALPTTEEPRDSLKHPSESKPSSVPGVETTALDSLCRNDEADPTRLSSGSSGRLSDTCGGPVGHVESPSPFAE